MIIFRTTLILLSVLGFSQHSIAQTHYDKARYATNYDQKLKDIMQTRESDWRTGPIVYQIIVDRFAPSTRIDEKKHYYAHPRSLQSWDTQPTQGHPVEGTDNWSHELAFWGGDLESLKGKLDYLESLGVEVLYLNPIQHALTNHKYDAIDYKLVSPEYGSRDDVIELAKALHKRGMKLVLDGVFNHMGSSSPFFKDAIANPNSPYRNWFFIGEGYKNGYRGWINARSLPELRLENKEVRDYIYRKRDSVVRGYLADGVDGWRLDVAFDVGPTVLHDLTKTAHKQKPGSLIIGEIWNYPDQWFPAVDGVMNFPLRKIIQSMLHGDLSSTSASHMMSAMVASSGIENLMRSWTLLDNHDTKRLKNMLPQTWQQTIAQTLQFTLPGSPNLYYGVELGMTGGDDPQNRGPMQWKLANDSNPDLIRTKQLIHLRKNHRAFRIGNYRKIISEKLWAFERYTDQALDTRFVLVNPTDKPVKESIMIQNWKIMNGSPVVDIFTQERFSEIRSSLMHMELAPHSIKVLQVKAFDGEWSPYKRIH